MTPQKYLTIRVPVPESFLHNAENSQTGRARNAFVTYMEEEAADIAKEAVLDRLGR